MNDQTPHRMTVDEYLPWALARGGRWELIDGRPVKMPSETLGHIDVKSFVWLALRESVAASRRTDLHVLADGATVRIDENNANEPDALIYSGPKRADSEIEIPDPVIVVEVISPTSGPRDKVRKRQDYFSLPSVEHYLAIDFAARTVIHFDKSNWQSDGRLLGEADVADLSPPGLMLPIRRCFSFS